MATVDVNVYRDLWAEVVPSSGKGLVSNNGRKMFVRQAAALPSSSVLFGHPVLSEASINVDLSAGTDKIYARLDRYAGDAEIGIVSFTAS